MRKRRGINPVCHLRENPCVCESFVGVPAPVPPAVAVLAKSIREQRGKARCNTLEFRPMLSKLGQLFKLAFGGGAIPGRPGRDERQLVKKPA
jgi:hypothetical protein